jgi:hypothetical protein
MVRSEARIPTPAADRYAKQLTNHAVHMGARSQWTPPHGLVELPQGGTCRVTAGPEELLLVAEASTPSQLATIQTVIAADVERFGRRRAVQVDRASRTSQPTTRTKIRYSSRRDSLTVPRQRNGPAASVQRSHVHESWGELLRLMHAVCVASCWQYRRQYSGGGPRRVPRSSGRWT